MQKLPLSVLILMIILALTAPLAANAQAGDLPVYVVKYGDTLYDIAAQFYTTVDAILQANGRTNGDSLSVGDRLRIPGLEGMRGVLASEYVPLGANLRSLSRRTQSNPASLVRLNKFTSQSELFVGRKIVVTIPEQDGNMTTMPSLLPEQSWMEQAILHGQNTWALARLNQLDSGNAALPLDTYYTISQSVSTNDLAIPGITSMVIGNLPLTQGSTYTLRVESEAPVEISANLAGTEAIFFPTGEGRQIAFGGINALKEPGTYPLNIQVETADGNTYRFDQWVIIGSGGFEVDAPLKVDPSTIESENVSSENAVFADIVNTPTPLQQWSGTFLYPIKGEGCVNSLFGSRRTYNDDPDVYYHTGLDLGYCYGIDVYAPAIGTVVATLPDQIVRGNVVVIDHGLGVFTIYMHLSEILIEVGEVVEPGQLIAYIGNTGRSNGPHLHFEIDINGTPVNPLAWFYRAFP